MRAIVILSSAVLSYYLYLQPSAKPVFSINVAAIKMLWKAAFYCIPDTSDMTLALISFIGLGILQRST